MDGTKCSSVGEPFGNSILGRICLPCLPSHTRPSPTAPQRDLDHTLARADRGTLPHMITITTIFLEKAPSCQSLSTRINQAVICLLTSPRTRPNIPSQTEYAIPFARNPGDKGKQSMSDMCLAWGSTFPSESHQCPHGHAHSMDHGATP